MNIEILTHLKIQLQERELKEEIIREVLSTPDQTVEGKSGRKVAQKKYLEGGKEYLIRVVFREGSNSRVGITAYKTSKVAKYWRVKE